MAKNWLTDEQVEEQIAELKQSEYVKLARKELRMKYKRRQTLYQLRNLEKRGRELSDAAVFRVLQQTAKSLRRLYKAH